MSDRLTKPAVNPPMAAGVTPALLVLLPVAFLVTMVAPNLLTRQVLRALPTAQPAAEWSALTWLSLLGLGLLLATLSGELLRLLAARALRRDDSAEPHSLARQASLQMLHQQLGTLARVLVCVSAMLGVRSATLAGSQRTAVAVTILMGLLLGLTADTIWLSFRRPRGTKPQPEPATSEREIFKS